VKATLCEFARVNDSVAATTKKLVKQKLLADYFRSLSDEQDLRLAVRYSGGRPFAATDERVLGVSGAIVSDVILRMFRIDPREYHAMVVRAGEIGEALSTIVEQTRERPGDRGAAPPRQPSYAPLTLHELSESFDALASTRNLEHKRSILRDVLGRCGNGREAAYLTKIIFADLRTGAREGVIQAAVAQAFARTLHEVQRCQLLIGDLDEVAVLAKNDALGCTGFRLFHPIQFMLATPQESAETAAATMAGRTFFAEDKLDGIRAQVHKSGDRIAIYTRTMDRADESFPDIVEAVRALPGEFLLDGEIVPWKDGVVLPFAHLQRRLGRKSNTAKLLRENPAAFVAFDLLYREGTLFMERSLRERRQHLEALFSDLAPAEPGGKRAALLLIRVIEVSAADQIERAFCLARDCRNEGLVLKDPDSIYSPGRRGKMWLKLKTHLPTFDCVVTAAEYGHGKRRGVLSDYTFAVWDREPADPEAQLVNVGKAYSGVTDEEIAQLTEIFLSLSRRRHGSVHAVEPKIVLEIACDQIQRSDRHASGYALRFPRIKRIRWDKRPQDADRLARIAELYDSTSNFARRPIVEAPPPQPGLFD
jgi:DNA ligase-1